MKKSSIPCILAFAGAIALSPVLFAQTQNPDTTQSSKVPDSTADKNSATTGSSQDQTGTLDKTSSKEAVTPLDKNPSMAPTDSGEKSATKDPTGTTGEPGVATNRHKMERYSDNAFIEKAAQGGMTEVELGKLAEEKASSSDVKQFGSMMVTDHSKADAELKGLAAKKGVTVPSTLDAKHQASVDKLRSLSGTAFDRAYVQAMVKDHEKDAAEFRRASTSAQDPDVKSFADNTLKVVETHLSDIKSIQNKLQ